MGNDASQKAITDALAVDDYYEKIAEKYLTKHPEIRRLYFGK